MPSSRVRNQQSGLALIVVLFIVALASILVINMTYSTYLGSRISVAAERSVQAEYLLKSALNFAMVMLKVDDPEYDSTKDFWGKFSEGVVLPPELLGLNVPNIRLELEIRPEAAKIYLKALTAQNLNGLPDIPLRDRLLRMCQKLELDKMEAIDSDGNAQSQPVTCHQLIANLIDYFDKDEEPYNDGDFVGSENENSKFANRTIGRIGELAAVPGFTAERVQKILPFVTAQGTAQININLASKLVISVLSASPDFDDATVDRIIAFRESEDGPIKSSNLSTCCDISSDAISDITNFVTYASRRFQVIAKVDYGTSTHFLRADLSRTTANQLPTIETLELFYL